MLDVCEGSMTESQNLKSIVYEYENSKMILSNIHVNVSDKKMLIEYLFYEKTLL